MDLSSILPLLMGGKNPQMAQILSAMNGGKMSGSESGNNNDGMAQMLASILSSQNKQNDKSQNTDTGFNPLTAALGGGAGGGGQTELLLNLMNSMSKQKPKHPSGLGVIQKIAPNDILGIMLKYYNRRKH